MRRQQAKKPGYSENRYTRLFFETVFFIFIVI